MAGVINDPDGARNMFFDRFACPEILAILVEEINVLVDSTCWKNRKGYPRKDDGLTLPRGRERGTFKRFYNSCFHLVATRWKYSKTLKFTSSIRKLEKYKSPDGVVNK